MKGQLPNDVKTNRHKRLQKLANDMQKRCVEGFIREKTQLEVLFENGCNGIFTGHTSNFINVKVKSDQDLGGSIGRVVLKKYNEKDGMTEGELI